MEHNLSSPAEGLPRTPESLKMSLFWFLVTRCDIFRFYGSLGNCTRKQPQKRLKDAFQFSPKMESDVFRPGGGILWSGPLQHRGQDCSWLATYILIGEKM